MGRWLSAFVVASAVVLSAQTAVAATWQLQSVPDPQSAVLNAVSCPSATTCIAVGSYRSGQRTVPLLDLWNGQDWSVMTTPTPEGTRRSSLDAVSCSSATSCVAVGIYGDGSTNSTLLAEVWNGHWWSIKSPRSVRIPHIPCPGCRVPHILNVDFRGVSCVSATSCIAVGDWLRNTSGGPLAARWNGHKWSVHAWYEGRNRHGASGFDDVSCVTATACTAVGGENDGRTLAERWNGSGWRAQSTPSPYGVNGGGDWLSHVSCESASFCVAPGGTATPVLARPFAMSWNGRRWSLERANHVPGDEPVDWSGVSCPSATWCVAVGSTYYPPNDYPVAQIRQNGVWSNAQLPPLSQPTKRFTGNDLRGVSCASATMCVVVGSDPDQRPFVLQYS
jgi:hypothetical protein